VCAKSVAMDHAGLTSSKVNWQDAPHPTFKVCSRSQIFVSGLAAARDDEERCVHEEEIGR
jgi:hypothetical protein